MSITMARHHESKAAHAIYLHWLIWITTCALLLFSITSWTAGGTPYSSYYFPKQNLNNIDFYFTIEHDPGTNTHYYWAQQFWFVNGSGGYLGLQRDGSLENGKTGKVAIFSIWDVYEHEASPGAYSTDFGGEGTGASVRMIYNWKPGHTYRFRLEKTSNRWWKVTIRDTVTQQDSYLGRIRVAAHWQGLKGNTQIFTEKFLDNKACYKYPYTLARFNPPSANYGSVSISRSSHWTGNVCTQAKTYAKNNVIYHETGINNKPKKTDNGKPNPNNGGNNQPKPSDSIDQGIYQLVARSTSKCLDNYVGGNNNGNSVEQETCKTQKSQQWKITPFGKHYRLQAMHSNKCLSVAGRDQGTNVEQQHCQNTSSQQWRVAKVYNYYQLQSVQQPSHCLGVRGVWRDSSVNIGACRSSYTTQHWQLKKHKAAVTQIKEGVYQLQLANSKQCLDNEAGGFTDGNNIIHWSCHKRSNQLWTLINVGKYFKLKSNQSNKCIESSANYQGANIHQWECQQRNNQRWHVQAIGSDYLIKATNQRDACLGSNELHQSGASIRIQSCKWGKGQRWKLIAK